METSISLNSITAMFGAMLVLAAIPSISVFAVTARSASFGFIHGVFTTMGIVIGDIIFILIAIFGLSILAETMGSFFILIKYLGGAYLIWSGISLWRSQPETIETEKTTNTSLLSSFLTGLFITLGDQKAILFYLGFFPAFVDLPTLTYLDTGIIIAITIVTVGGAKLCYAFMASKAKLLISAASKKRMDMIAGSVMIIVGLFLIWTSYN